MCGFDLQAVVAGVIVVSRAAFLAGQLQLQVLAGQLIVDGHAVWRNAMADNLDGIGFLRSRQGGFEYVEVRQISFFVELIAKLTWGEDAQIGLRRRRGRRDGDGRFGVGFRCVRKKTAGRVQVHDDIGLDNGAIDARKTLRLGFAARRRRPRLRFGGRQMDFQTLAAHVHRRLVLVVLDVNVVGRPD